MTPLLVRVVVALVALSVCPREVVAAAGRQTFEDLVANLKSPNAKTRQESAATLAKSRRREAIAPLSALVHDPELKVRMEVVRALNQLRDVSAVPALVTSMGDGDPKIREESIGALVEVYAERDRTTAVTRYLEVFSDEYDRASVPPYAAVDASVFRAFADALRDPEGDIREQAALAIGILDGKAVVKDLVTALQDPDADVRGASATAIGKVGETEDGLALVPVLADDNTGVRTRVLKALGTLRLKDAGPPLRAMFEANRKREAGTKVLECLSRIGDASQADLLRELTADPDVERRRLAVEGLGRISDPGILPAFKKDYQREKSEEMKLALSFALTLLGDRAFLDSIVLGLPSRLYGSRCRRYLLEMGKPLLPELYPYLNDPDEDVRAELIDAIAAMGDSQSIATLQPLISDPSRKVSDRANRAVERLRRHTGQQ